MPGSTLMQLITDVLLAAAKAGPAMQDLLSGAVAVRTDVAHHAGIAKELQDAVAALEKATADATGFFTAK